MNVEITFINIEKGSLQDTNDNKETLKKFASLREKFNVSPCSEWVLLTTGGHASDALPHSSLRPETRLSSTHQSSAFIITWLFLPAAQLFPVSLTKKEF